VGLNGFLLKPVYASVMYNTLLDILGIKAVPRPLAAKEKIQTPDLENVQGAHILLVDDNSINQEVATEFLEDAGMIVTVVSNGRECLDAVGRRSYDLVLMDIQMPEMDGLEVTRRIRRNSRFKDLPIIAMTAHAMSGDKDKSLAAGMNDHITKPFDPAVLYQTLKNWIPENRAVRPRKKPYETPVVTTTVEVVLPSLPGIDQEEALKVLNHNTPLFLTLLYNFKKSFGSLPTLLRELSEAGQWSEIRDKAHAVKGVAGYIGSSFLVQAAQRLEEALKNDQREDAANHLVSFINALDTILSSLSALPAKDEDAFIEDKHSPARDIEGTEGEDQVQVLIGQLKRGELAAEEQFTEVARLLAGSGFDEHLKTIAALIDDIEYEKAAEIAGNLLNAVQQKRGN
jgi:two-component system, sensor histidine kinase and response regulator